LYGRCVHQLQQPIRLLPLLPGHRVELSRWKQTHLQYMFAKHHGDLCRLSIRQESTVERNVCHCCSRDRSNLWPDLRQLNCCCYYAAEDGRWCPSARTSEGGSVDGTDRQWPECGFRFGSLLIQPDTHVRYTILPSLDMIDDSSWEHWLPRFWHFAVESRGYRISYPVLGRFLIL